MKAIATHPNKKGQFGMLRIFSYALYAFGAIVLIITLSLATTSCALQNKEAKAEIGNEAGLYAAVKADTQLNSYLRTDMPAKNELFERLDWLEKNKNTKYVKELMGALKIDFKSARDFLEKHPETVSDRDYSGFITALHAVHISGNDADKESVRQTFKAATAALFLRSVNDYPRKGERVFYLLPLTVDFNPADFWASKEQNPCGNAELCAYYLPAIIAPGAGNSKFVSHAINPVPLADHTAAKVEFWYYPEIKHTLPLA